MKHGHTTARVDFIQPMNIHSYTFVTVSTAAKDWKVTPRRIRALLIERRLQGFRGENGYWQVVHPYRFTFGRRGPALKRSQKSEWSSE